MEMKITDRVNYFEKIEIKTSETRNYFEKDGTENKWVKEDGNEYKWDKKLVWKYGENNWVKEDGKEKYISEKRNYFEKTEMKLSESKKMEI